MDYHKFDAALSSALDQDSSADADLFLVSVRAARALSPAELRELRQLGGLGTETSLPVYSVRITRENLPVLAAKPWVRLISLAQRLSPA